LFLYSMKIVVNQKFPWYAEQYLRSKEII